MPDPASILENFVAQILEAVSSGGSQRETVDAVRGVVIHALETPGWLPQRCQQPAPECYARHLLHRDPEGRFTIVAMVWQPGQKTPIHDHGGMWCVEGVYEGRIRVARYDLDGPVGGSIAKLHGCECIDAGIGTTGALIPPVDYHSIENPALTKAITIHTYGGDMKTCRVYLPRTEGDYDVRMKSLAYTSVPATAGAHVPGRN